MTITGFLVVFSPILFPCVAVLCFAVAHFVKNYLEYKRSVILFRNGWRPYGNYCFVPPDWTEDSYSGALGYEEAWERHCVTTRDKRLKIPQQPPAPVLKPGRWQEDE